MYQNVHRHVHKFVTSLDKDDEFQGTTATFTVRRHAVGNLATGNSADGVAVRRT